MHTPKPKPKPKHSPSSLSSALLYREIAAAIVSMYTDCPTQKAFLQVAESEESERRMSQGHRGTWPHDDGTEIEDQVRAAASINPTAADSGTISDY